MTAIPERTVQATPLGHEVADHTGIRPLKLADFVGQPQLRENLTVFIQAAKQRQGVLDHVILHGPPGLGKTTLAQIVAKELGVGFRSTSGPVINKQGDLAAILTTLEAHDVLFIDEIHRLPAGVEEVLYSAMEDFKLDIIIGEGPAARTVKIDLPPFTLIGATTRAGMLSAPLRDRFGVQLRLEYYSPEDLQEVLLRAARRQSIPLQPQGAYEIARRARGTPRIAHRLLRRVWDYATVHGTGDITSALADHGLTAIQVDKLGLDRNDYRYLETLLDRFNGGPVGLDTLAAAIGEARDTLEDVVEPFLLQLGFIERTPRGRLVLAGGYAHLGRKVPQQAQTQASLLDS